MLRSIKEHHVTVAIDLLRASTAICAAFKAGCVEVMPLDTLNDIGEYRKKGWLIAAEREGRKVDIDVDGQRMAADYGNSPTEYLMENLTGERLAYSTTNGTVCITQAADSEKVVVGCFSNIDAIIERLTEEGRDAVLLCAGWKKEFCLEDTLVAGAIIEGLQGRGAEIVGDASYAALTLWSAAKENPLGFCSKASHIERLRRMGAEADIEYAFKRNTYDGVPTMMGGTLKAR